MTQALISKPEVIDRNLNLNVTKAKGYPAAAAAADSGLSEAAPSKQDVAGEKNEDQKQEQFTFTLPLSEDEIRSLDEDEFPKVVEACKVHPLFDEFRRHEYAEIGDDMAEFGDCQGDPLEDVVNFCNFVVSSVVQAETQKDEPEREANDKEKKASEAEVAEDSKGKGGTDTVVETQQLADTMKDGEGQKTSDSDVVEDGLKGKVETQLPETMKEIEDHNHKTSEAEDDTSKGTMAVETHELVGSEVQKTGEVETKEDGKVTEEKKTHEAEDEEIEQVDGDDKITQELHHAEMTSKVPETNQTQKDNTGIKKFFNQKATSEPENIEDYIDSLKVAQQAKEQDVAAVSAETTVKETDKKDKKEKKDKHDKADKEKKDKNDKKEKKSDKDKDKKEKKHKKDKSDKDKKEKKDKSEPVEDEAETEAMLVMLGACREKREEEEAAAKAAADSTARGTKRPHADPKKAPASPKPKASMAAKAKANPKSRGKGKGSRGRGRGRNGADAEADAPEEREEEWFELWWLFQVSLMFHSLFGFRGIIWLLVLSLSHESTQHLHSSLIFSLPTDQPRPDVALFRPHSTTNLKQTCRPYMVMTKVQLQWNSFPHSQH